LTLSLNPDKLFLCIFRIHFLAKLRQPELDQQEKVERVNAVRKEYAEAMESGHAWFFSMVVWVA
jgi:energy-converting hydrogenase A subunit M